MKAIFLDIDGVLNCKKTSNPRKFPYVVDGALLARYCRVLNSTGAKVVLSSTWHMTRLAHWQLDISAFHLLMLLPTSRKSLDAARSLRGWNGIPR